MKASTRPRASTRTTRGSTTTRPSRVCSKSCGGVSGSSALGEIGLDYHYDNSPREVQREVFARQLRLAREEGLPVIIHSREADEETAEILRARA